MKSLSIIVAGLALLVFAPAGASAETLSPGKNVAYTFLTGVPVGLSYTRSLRCR